MDIYSLVPLLFAGCVIIFNWGFWDAVIDFCLLEEHVGLGGFLSF